MRTILGIERRRTGALPVALVLTGLGIVLTLFALPPISSYGLWSSSWAAGARWISDYDIVIGPVAAVATAWVGGRERRCGTGELLATTPRSPLRRTALTWAAVSSGVLLGMLGFGAFVAAAIAPTVSYGGGRWPVSWALAIGGVIACASIGFLAGRAVPGRLVAPATGVVIYLVAGVAGYFHGGWTHLTLVANLPLSEATQLPALIALEYAGLLIALTAGLLLLAAGRGYRRPALAVIVVAAVLAIPLGTTSAATTGASDEWVEADPAADRPVCTSTAPIVCTTQVHAGLLPALTPLARELLTSAREVLPVDRAVEGSRFSRERRIEHGTLPLDNLDGRSLLLRRGLARPEELVSEQGRDLAVLGDCTNYPRSFTETEVLLEDVATGLILGRPSTSVGAERATRLRAYLTAEPGRARAWMADYVSATTSCDVEALRALAEPSSS